MNCPLLHKLRHRQFNFFLIVRPETDCPEAYYPAFVQAVGIRNTADLKLLEYFFSINKYRECKVIFFDEFFHFTGIFLHRYPDDNEITLKIVAKKLLKLNEVFFTLFAPGAEKSEDNGFTFQP